MVEKQDRDKRTGRFIRGNKAGFKHGAYSLARVRNVPSIRGVRALAMHLDEVKSELEASTPEMNVKKELLIGQVVKTEEKILLMDMWLRKFGIIKADRARKGSLELQSCLVNSYLSFLNTQRLALSALGLEGRQAVDAMTLQDIVDEVDKKKKRKRRSR